ncbi:DUF4836 family protein [Sphingobacterium sp. SYP-B4668]|uniref:DUF4836 family protein n=1 Tax=Sphingobacterium sp. SYP-B4668 TaxID=2996035 RepID=UPI0022DDEE46|nr:DUF4836 family protein [Sphingobacterium sp. SYP-B4668]
MQIRLSVLMMVGLCAVTAIPLKAQQLANRIPKEADVVAVLNPKEIMIQSNAKLLNETLVKSGFFNNFQDAMGHSVDRLEDIGVDLQQYMYAYHRRTDSISYTGYIAPISNLEKFESLLPDSLVNLGEYEGYQYWKNSQGTLLAWNKDVIYVLEGSLHTEFFDVDSIANRYGIDHVDMAVPYEYLEEDDVAEPTQYEEDMVIDDSWLEGELVDSASVLDEIDTACAYVIQDEEEMTFEAYPFDEEVDTAEVDYMIEDTAYDQAYADSVAKQHAEAQQKNDSIHHVLSAQWTENEMKQLLSPSHEPLSNSYLGSIHKKMPLARVWIKSVDELYGSILPTSYLSSIYQGFNPQSIMSGYKEAIFDLEQQGNTLKITSRLGLEQDLLETSKRIYNHKPNPKFFKYLTDSTVGFMSLNINSEAYMKGIPNYLASRYQWLFGTEQEIISLATLAIDIAFDEYAISKIMPGDNLVVVNGVTKLKMEYMDYEYDDDYNMKEVMQSKEEVVPRFVWMFTSKDQRLIVKGLQLAVAKEVAQYVDDIYEIPRKRGQEFPMYVLFKDDIVMVSNDRQELVHIQQGKLGGKPNKSFEKIVKNNVFSTVLQPKRIPALLSEMDVPISKEWRASVDELAQYGNVVISSRGIVKNEAVAELSLTLPSEKAHALEYILTEINRQLLHSGLE